MTVAHHRSHAGPGPAPNSKGVVRDEGGNIVVEYAAKREVVRLHAGQRGEGSFTEMPLDGFLAQLGIDGTLGATRRWYLLVSSPGLTRPGSPGEVVRAFSSEAEGRDAFRRIRLAPGSRSGWAQLLALDEAGLKLLCWFGFPSEPSAAPPREGGRGEATPGPLRKTSRLRRALAGVGLALPVMDGAPSPHHRGDLHKREGDER